MKFCDSDFPFLAVLTRIFASEWLSIMQELLLNKVKVIFFDWFKTLSSSLFFDVDSIDFNVKKSLQQTLFYDNNHLLEPWMRGQITYREIIKKISSANVDLTESLIFQAFRDSCSNMKLDDNKSLHLISKIRESGRKVVIATDNMDVFRLFTIPSLSLDSLFDDILSSHELGYLKQDTENGKLFFFDNYLRENQFRTSEAILLDDCTSTIDLCRSYGLNGISIQSSYD
jgi:FMN phosphatase YigB (HAD superfamily)